MTFRIIPRLEIKNRHLIKGKKMEGLKKIGDPIEFLKRYYQEEPDEIFICDIVASLYSRKFDFDYLKELSKNIFIPFAVGGGLNNLRDINFAFKNGADKVVLNSYLFKDISILNKISNIYGKQSTVAEVQFKKISDTYELRYESGRNNPKRNIFEWMQKLEKNCVGEIYITSVDNDGMENKEIDFNFLKKMRKTVEIPLIYGGGISSRKDIDKLSKIGFQGAAISRSLHNKELKICDLK